MLEEITELLVKVKHVKALEENFKLKLIIFI